MLTFSLFVAAFIGLPITFVLLPASRKRAKVRWSHIGRVWVYSWFIPFTVLYLAGAIFFVAMWFDALDDPAQIAFMPWLAAVVPWALLVGHWTFAIRNYLKMPHALGVVLLMGLLCVLVAGGAAFWATELMRGAGW